MQVRWEHLDSKELQEHLVTPDLLDHLAHRDRRVLLGHQAPVVSQELKDQVDQVVLRVKLVALDNLDRLDQVGTQEALELLDLKALLDRKEVQVHRAGLGLRVQLVAQDQLVLLEHKARGVTLDHLDSRDSQVKPDLLDQPVQPGHQVHRELAVILAPMVPLD